MPDFIKLPSERVEQLRALSKVRNTTIANLIAEYVNHEIEAGNLPDAVPGIAVRRRGARVHLDFGDFTKTLDLDLARAFATTLRWLATPKKTGMAGALTEAAQALSGAHLVGLSRHATSVKVTGEGGTRTLAPSVARDLARVIDKAAA